MHTRTAASGHAMTVSQPDSDNMVLNDTSERDGPCARHDATNLKPVATWRLGYVAQCAAEIEEATSHVAVRRSKLLLGDQSGQDSIGADGPCGREEPTPAAPAPARQEQCWAVCEDDEYVDWAVCDDDDADAWEGADAYGAYDM